MRKLCRTIIECRTWPSRKRDRDSRRSRRWAGCSRHLCVDGMRGESVMRISHHGSSRYRSRRARELVAGGTGLRGRRCGLEHPGVPCRCWNQQRRTSCWLTCSLGDGSSTELVRTLRRLRLKARVIIITGFSDEFAVVEALSAGVSGYVVNPQPTTELLEAIRSVAAGRRYVPPSLEARLALRPVPMGDETQIAGPVGLERLSPREVNLGPGGRRIPHPVRRLPGGCASASRPSRPTAPT